MPDMLQAAREAAETGFRPVPWEDYMTDLEDLPASEERRPMNASQWCQSNWRGWTCNRPRGHAGSHRVIAQTPYEAYVAAEWHSPRCPLYQPVGGRR